MSNLTHKHFEHKYRNRVELHKIKKVLKFMGNYRCMADALPPGRPRAMGIGYGVWSWEWSISVDEAAAAAARSSQMLEKLSAKFLQIWRKFIIVVFYIYFNLKINYTS